MTFPSTASFEHKFLAYRRTWRGSVLSTFGLPVLFLTALGWSVGAYVNRRGVLPVPYLEYIGPGLLANTALQIGMGEMGAPIFAAVKWTRTYQAMRASPMTVSEIIYGQLGYVLLRTAVGTTGFLLVLTAFGLLHTWWAVAMVPAAMLITAACSLPVFAFSANLQHEANYPLLQRFVVLPMSLFAGVFFPVSAMPKPARLAAYASPMYHGVELCRAAAFGSIRWWALLLHVGYLLLWAVVAFEIGRRALTRRLSD
jgi:lipooligosaccharide transport system permease protein